MKIGGIFYLKKDNKPLVTTEGEFTFNLGKPKRQAEKNGALGVAGFSAEAQVPYVDGEIYDIETLDVEELLEDIEDLNSELNIPDTATVDTAYVVLEPECQEYKAAFEDLKSQEQSLLLEKQKNEMQEQIEMQQQGKAAVSEGAQQD